MKFSVSEISDLMRYRRTIYPKDYTERAVHRELVERILTNATWAPNHGMTQPWRFMVFTGDARKRLSDRLGDIYLAHTPADKVLPRKLESLRLRPLQSSVVIAIGLHRDPSGKINERDELLAMGCAVQNMHLTCAAYGLGAFWATGAPMTGPAMKEFLGLGEQDLALGLFYIGYPGVEWPKGYRKPLDQLVQWVDQ